MRIIVDFTNDGSIIFERMEVFYLDYWNILILFHLEQGMEMEQYNAWL